MMLIDTPGGAETSSVLRGRAPHRVTRVDRDLAPAYAAETARLVRQRLAIVSLLFVVLMGSGVAFEAVSHPEHRTLVLVFWVAESGLVVLAALACRLPGLERRTLAIGGIMTGGVATLITLYHALSGGLPERDAMAFGALLTGLAVLLPWGARVQAAAASLALLG